MEKFNVVTGVAAPMLLNNINTDLIAPSHFPGKKPEEAVLMPMREKMFANLRYFPDGTRKPDFVLDQPRYIASVLKYEFDLSSYFVPGSPLRRQLARFPARDYVPQMPGAFRRQVMVKLRQALGSV